MTGKLGAASCLLFGCALAAVPRPASASAPAVDAASADTTRLEAGERTQQERWSAPFAVTSRGRTAPRTERAVVVLRDSTARSPRAEPSPDAAAPAPPAASPSAPAPAAATPPARGSAAAGRTATSAPAATTPPRTTPPRATPARTPPPAASNRTHRVEWGDTWYAIARQYGVSSRDLAAANPEVDPEKLVSGRVLRIPAAAAGAAAGAARRTHKVESGESLWGIARRYGVSTDALRRANKLEDDRVRIGATLVIPGGD